MRRQARRDGTHDDRKRDFENAGCTVCDLHSAGVPGLPDFVVGCLGMNHLVECKDLATQYGRAGLNANQNAFARHWNGGPVFIACTTKDVIDLVTLWRTRKQAMRQ